MTIVYQLRIKYMSISDGFIVYYFNIVGDGTDKWLNQEIRDLRTHHAQYATGEVEIIPRLIGQRPYYFE